MTATSALSATQTPSIANPLGDLVASLRTVVVPASPTTYANRTELRAMGLRWDPAGHRWHGTTTSERVRELREQLGLDVRVFGTLEPPRGPKPPRPPTGVALPSPVVASDPVRRARDGSRTHFESRIALPGPDEDEEDVATPTRRFSLLEITSGLPDDSREAEERGVERRLRELRARVKAARAVVATTPGLAETLARHWQRAARFYAGFGITLAVFRQGVPHSQSPSKGVSFDDGSGEPVDLFTYS
jgi:hypothetical protein